MLKGYRMLDMIKLWGSSSWVLINHVLKSSSPRTHAWKSAPGNWRQNSSEHRAWSLMYHNVKSWWNSGGVTVLWARLDDGEVLKPYRCLYKHSAESHDTVCRTDLLFSPSLFYLFLFLAFVCFFLFLWGLLRNIFSRPMVGKRVRQSQEPVSQFEYIIESNDLPLERIQVKKYSWPIGNWFKYADDILVVDCFTWIEREPIMSLCVTV